MRKTLVVVDVQKDFYHPNGALYVKGGEALPERIAKIIPLFDNVIFTLDYHPYNHCSFVDNGGQWPMHCVEHTEGASLPLEFMKIQDYACVYKGRNANEEEYGANAFQIKGASWKPFVDDQYPDEYVFCGIHALYCVKETIKNFIEAFPNVKVSVLIDCIAPLDCDEFNTFCIENSITQKSISDF